jgi:hypothetical protein
MKSLLERCFSGVGVAGGIPGGDRERLAGLLGACCGAKVYPRSVTPIRQSLVFLCADGGGKRIGAVSPVPGLAGELGAAVQIRLEGIPAWIANAPAAAGSAAWLRGLLPAMRPQALGLKRSAGFGDRLGLATPGHVRAVRKSDMAPVFAQQSVRENERTGRSPQQVLDDAMFGAFQEGWQGAWGADADHLKSTADIEAFAAAGYSFFTVDPGAFVDNAAAAASGPDLQQKLQAVPWGELESTPADLQGALAGKTIDLGEFKARFGAEEILRAAAKYGAAVAHTVRLHRHLAEGLDGRPFDFEMSVDETDSPTTLGEHVYVASELRRMGVNWVSLAPRFVGAFEKGVDFIGDPQAFEKSFAQHAAVARAFGPYKLSIHSGSDKLSIYPIAARLAGELVHLKTAGTSYLEALRAVAQVHPALFDEILKFAVGRYPADRATYHVSAEAGRIPGRGDPAALLDNFDARQVLHVTYGSVLQEKRLRGPLFETLRRHEEDYTRIVEAHFDRHLSLFG